jgi:D-glycero-D-manno-heptose 1,7-bisphosphate phosphatase
MFLRAAEKFGIILEQSIMIGDKKSDMQAAKAAGIVNRIQILNSKNEFFDSELATTSVESLLEIDFNLFSFLGNHS